MASNILRRKMMGASSIVQRVSHRSVTGLELGIDVHTHYDIIFLCWNTLYIVECYNNCIQRYSLDIQCTRGVQKMFELFGLTGRCSCTYGSNPELGTPCIFRVLPMSARHFISNAFSNPMAPRTTLSCRYKISSFWETTGHHYITSFSLKNSLISTAYTDRFPRYDDLLRVRNTLGALLVKFGPDYEHVYPSSSFRSLHKLKMFLKYADALS
jgi:hypothetical protein